MTHTPETKIATTETYTTTEISTEISTEITDQTTRTDSYHQVD